MTDARGPEDHVDESPENDRTAALLRDALSTEAAMVQPAGDGLQKIREGVDAGRRPWWRHPAMALVAAAVLGLVAGGVYVGVRGDDGATVVADDGTPTPASTPSVTESASPSESPSESPSPSRTESTSPSSSPASGGGTTYVYYVHDDGQAPRLYREQHAGVGGGGTAAQALRRMLQGKPDDPDYATPWDATTLRSYSRSGDTATVDLSGWVSLSKPLERAAVQEIVYTVTANDPAVKKVRFLVDGATPTGTKTDVSKPVGRAPRGEVQGLIWLQAPKQGATVSSPVSIDGFGTAFEATISWEVRKDGNVVAQGTTQGGSNGEFGDFHDSVKLDPGTYEVSAFEVSAESGDPVHIDTKTITVT